MEKEEQVSIKVTNPGSSWLKALEEKQVRSMSLDPSHDHTLIKALNSATNWIVEFENEDSVFFVREEAYLKF